jgi:hypothetical protein
MLECFGCNVERFQRWISESILGELDLIGAER